MEAVTKAVLKKKTEDKEINTDTLFHFQIGLLCSPLRMLMTGINLDQYKHKQHLKCDD